MQPALYPVLIGGFFNSMASSSPLAGIWGAALVALPLIVKRFQTHQDDYMNRMAEKAFYGERIALIKQFFGLNFKERSEPLIKNQLEAARSNFNRTREYIDARYNMLSHGVAVVAAVAAIAYVSLPIAAVVTAGIIPLLRIEKKKARFAEKVRTNSVRFHKSLWPSFFDLSLDDVVSQVKTMRQSNWAEKRISDLSSGIIGLYNRMYKGLLRSNLAAWQVNSVTTLVAGSYIMWQAMTGVISPGNAVTFFGSVGALQVAMTGISGLWGTLAQSAPYVNRCFRLTDIWRKIHPAENPHDQQTTEKFHEKLQANPVNISLKNIKIIRDGKTILDIEDLSFSFGEFCGIVGLRGAGKSTMINTILGIYEPDQGKVVLSIGDEDFDLKEVPLEAWHSVVGYSPQDGYQGRSLSVQERILLGIHSDSLDPKTLDEVMKITGADEFIRAEETTKVFIGEGVKKSGSRKFSGGEHQTLANCSALIGNHKVSILDEPSAKLDNKNAKKLVEEIRANGVDKLQLVISHNLKALEYADRIIVLNGGKVEAIGTHDELMQDKSGTYYGLYTDGLRDADKKILERALES